MRLGHRRHLAGALRRRLRLRLAVGQRRLRLLTAGRIVLGLRALAERGVDRRLHALEIGRGPGRWRIGRVHAFDVVAGGTARRRVALHLRRRVGAGP